jgi:hypothetical protein
MVQREAGESSEATGWVDGKAKLRWKSGENKKEKALRFADSNLILDH